jgi:hypothetical protein
VVQLAEEGGDVLAVLRLVVHAEVQRVAHEPAVLRGVELADAGDTLAQILPRRRRPQEDGRWPE